MNTRSRLVLVVFFLTAAVHASDSAYFPAGVFSEDPVADKAANEVLGEYLLEAGEPPLSSSSGSEIEEEYRLLWAPPFRPPIVVRLTREGDRAMSTVVRWGNEDPETEPLSSTSDMECSAWKSVQREMRRARFWSHMRNEPRERDVIDASYWIIEGRRGDEYKIVQRSPPDLEKDRELIRLGERLLEVAGFDLEDLGLVDLLEDMSHDPSEGSRSRRARDE
jgi:hypothetical protein